MDNIADGDDDDDDDDDADDDGDDTFCARLIPQLRMFICLCTFPIADWADAADGPMDSAKLELSRQWLQRHIYVVFNMGLGLGSRPFTPVIAREHPVDVIGHVNRSFLKRQYETGLQIPRSFSC